MSNMIHLNSVDLVEQFEERFYYLNQKDQKVAAAGRFLKPSAGFPSRRYSVISLDHPTGKTWSTCFIPVAGDTKDMGLIITYWTRRAGVPGELLVKYGDFHNDYGATASKKMNAGGYQVVNAVMEKDGFIFGSRKRVGNSGLITDGYSPLYGFQESYFKDVKGDTARASVLAAGLETVLKVSPEFSSFFSRLQKKGFAWELSRKIADVNVNLLGLPNVFHSVELSGKAITDFMAAAIGSELEHLPETFVKPPAPQTMSERYEAWGSFG